MNAEEINEIYRTFRPWLMNKKQHDILKQYTIMVITTDGSTCQSYNLMLWLITFDKSVLYRKYCLSKETNYIVKLLHYLLSNWRSKIIFYNIEIFDFLERIYFHLKTNYYFDYEKTNHPMMFLQYNDKKDEILKGVDYQNFQVVRKTSPIVSNKNRISFFSLNSDCLDIVESFFIHSCWKTAIYEKAMRI